MIAAYVLMAVLLLLSGFFSGVETAFTSLTQVQVQNITNDRPKRGALIARLMDRPDLLLATVLIGNNLVNISLSVLVSDVVIRLYGDGALGITTGVLTLVVLIFGEVGPKQLAIVHNEFVCTHAAPFVRLLSVLLRPVIVAITAVSRIFTRLMRNQRTTTFSLDTILTLVKHAENIGVIDTFKTKMVRSVFRFSDVSVHAIMTHRTKVFSLNQNDRVRDVAPEIAARGLSRIPIYGDSPEHIVGIVLEKEVLRSLATDQDDRALKQIMIEPVIVPESWKVQRVFNRLKRAKTNMAIVLDEYGGLAGVVTMEDLVEEIIGDIYDENEVPESAKMVRLPDGNIRVRGDTPMHDLEDFLGTTIEHDRSAETVAGFLIACAGQFPTAEQTLSTSVGVFTIEQVSRKRIEQVRLAPQEQSPDTNSR